MCNLNELTHYDDPVDQWAAEQEKDLRDRRYGLARKGVVGIVADASRAARAFADALAGLDRIARAPSERER